MYKICFIDTIYVSVLYLCVLDLDSQIIILYLNNNQIWIMLFVRDYHRYVIVLIIIHIYNRVFKYLISCRMNITHFYM